MRPRILVIEDDPEIARVITDALSDVSDDIVHIARGDSGLTCAETQRFDLLILDLSLPGMSGMDVCRSLREHDAFTPILILTARADSVDKVVGLELGADDYLTKPFSVQELRARARAILRRTMRPAPKEADEAHPETAVFDDLEINFQRRTVKRAGAAIDLTPTQFDILQVLARSPGRVFSLEEILAEACGYSSSSYAGALITQLSRLRARIEPDRDNPRFILTVKGIGYRFVARDELA